MRIRHAVAAGVGSLALVGGLAVPALAQSDSSNDALAQSADNSTCGQITLTFEVKDAAPGGPNAEYAWTYGKGNLDGTGDQNLGIVNVTKDSPETVTVDNLEDGEFVSYGTFSGPETDVFLAHGFSPAQVASDDNCTPPQAAPSEFCQRFDEALDRLEERFPDRDFPRADNFYQQRCGDRISG